MIKETIGGVSPLKARQSSRGGKEAGKATQTARKGRGTYEGPGGHAKSKGKRGAGGKNVGGYNVRTRFGPVTPWVKPTSGGTIGGDIVKSILGGGGGGGSQSQSRADATATAGTPAEGYWEKTGTELPSYRQAWDKNLENVQKSYKTFEDYVADIEGQKKMAKDEDWEGIAKKKGISVEEAKATFERRKGKDGQWRWVETKAATKGSSSSSASASASSGK